jgi:hypothetical protein
MMTPLRQFLTTAALLTLAALSPAYAGTVILPHTFQAGSPAVAAQVNDNFSIVAQSVDDNDSRIAALEAAIVSLQVTALAQAETIVSLQLTISDQDSTIAGQAASIVNQASILATVERSNVLALDAYLTVNSDSRGPLVQLAGVNLQIINGQGATDTTNGLGNIIVGYDEESTLTRALYCSDGSFDNQTDCENVGETWSHSHKNGSHYLVLGSQNNYSQYGGLLVGLYNSALGHFSSVSGGKENTARGAHSSISGGSGNDASGPMSSISGGNVNSASGNVSSISGGVLNSASGDLSSVSGGNERTASGVEDWAAGSLWENR